MTEKRVLKVLFTKSGSGSINARISLPITWIRELGLNEENREVILELKDEKIILTKYDKN